MIRVSLLAAFLAFAAAETVPSRNAQAQGVGTLSVSPKRVVFEGRDRSAELLLINQSDTETAYRVFFENRRMTDDGRLEKIDQPDDGQLFAEAYLRYAPRQVRIPPGGTQTIRVMVRKPRDLAPGEYRSHLVMRSLPPEQLGVSIEDVELGEDELRVQIIPLYGVAIPIIVRHGDLAGKVELAAVGLMPPSDGYPTSVELRLNRSGTRSFYGDLFLKYLQPGGNLVEVGVMRGAAIYTPNTSRSVRVPLQPPEGLVLSGGMLTAEYRQPADDGGDLLARIEAQLP